jgi:nucleoside-diphosphate-sugar epimerase
MKRVLIIGGAGYIGSRLIKTIANNYKIVVIDRFWFGDYLPDSVKKIKQDALNLNVEDVKGFDCVIFLGGLSNDPMADYSPKQNFIENAAIPAYLAYICKKAKVKRFIYAGSCSVYGFTDNKPLDESSPINPQYPYGISKLLGEKGIMTLADSNFRPISLRQGTVGGWSPRMRFDLVVNTMTKCALNDKKISVHNPNLWRPLIDIRDLIQAYVKSIEADLEISGIYNISGGNYTIGDLGQKIHSYFISEGYDVELEIGDKKDVRNYKVNIDAAIKDLNFTPQYNPVDSVKDIFYNMDLKQCNLKDPKYYNIEVFKTLHEMVEL